jgi:large subunit ribosomal protein L17
MRHGVAGYKLGRTKDQRKGLRRTLINQLFEHERIRTTRAKALAIRSEAEQLITLARNSGNGSDIDKVNARRLAAARLANRKQFVNFLMTLPRGIQTATAGTPAYSSWASAWAMPQKLY